MDYLKIIILEWIVFDCCKHNKMIEYGHETLNTKRIKGYVSQYHSSIHITQILFETSVLTPIDRLLYEIEWL